MTSLHTPTFVYNLDFRIWTSKTIGFILWWRYTHRFSLYCFHKVKAWQMYRRMNTHTVKTQQFYYIPSVHFAGIIALQRVLNKFSGRWLTLSKIGILGPDKNLSITKINVRVTLIRGPNVYCSNDNYKQPCNFCLYLTAELSSVHDLWSWHWIGS